MSYKSLLVFRNTYDEYCKSELNDLATFLIQNFDWSEDSMITVFKHKLKEGIDNNGVILKGDAFAFPMWKLKMGFFLLDDYIRKYK